MSQMYALSALDACFERARCVRWRKVVWCMFGVCLVYDKCMFNFLEIPLFYRNSKNLVYVILIFILKFIN